MKKLKNKSVLITGASRGIGKALAIELLKNQNNVILIARHTNEIESYVQELSPRTAKAYIYKCDVRLKEEIQKVYEKIKEEVGVPDVAILNAGVGKEMSLTQFNSTIAEEIIQTNFLGMVYFAEQLLPDFIKKGKGILAGISSLADNRGFPRSGLYTASKAAVSIFLESLRAEGKIQDIKIITIKPGFIATAMTAQNNWPMPFLMPPGKAAKIIINGIAKEKRIIRFPIATALLARIIGLIPGRLYEFIASKF
jgi:short-subunit dehydrogenase